MRVQLSKKDNQPSTSKVKGTPATPTVYGNQVIERPLPNNIPVWAVSKAYLDQHPELHSRLLDSHLDSDDEDVDILAVSSRRGELGIRSRGARRAANEIINTFLDSLSGFCETSEDEGAHGGDDAMDDA